MRTFAIGCTVLNNRKCGQQSFIAGYNTSVEVRCSCESPRSFSEVLLSVQCSLAAKMKCNEAPLTPSRSLAYSRELPHLLYSAQGNIHADTSRQVSTPICAPQGYGNASLKPMEGG